jgi:pilus assembly protein CpaF
MDQWIERVFGLPGVTDLCINGSFEEVFVDRGDGLEPLGDDDRSGGAERPQDELLKSWVLDQLARAGKSWDARYPFVDATIASGLRLHVAFPPIARRGILVSLRKLPHLARRDLSEKDTLERARTGAQERWGSSPLFPKLIALVRAGDSLVVAGATGSGKTTLANDLLTEVPIRERIIALEDTPELAPAHPHFLSLVSRPPNADGFGEVTLRMLLRQTLRMRPDRIVLGECRGPEVLELLQALNTGHRGAMATLHANSPRDAIRRIELLCLLSGAGSLPLQAVRELIACGVGWIAQVQRRQDPGLGARREITDLWKIDGREGDSLLLRPYRPELAR